MASNEHPPFHFSPRPNRAHEIRWRPWGAEAFEEARREDKPILLAISAVWCHWCHVMDETTYSDEQVIRLINEHFVPVRVDNDQRPDVNARYNMGGWPTTAFLTPDGEVLSGATYVPPEQFRQALEQVSSYYHEHRDDIAQKVAELRERRRRAFAEAGAPGELSDQILTDVLRAIADAYDPVFGGFGTQPKFPHVDAIDLLLYVSQRRGDPDALHMARKTLERMADGGLFDHVWGGFFRYATNRDWSVPHFEKMLEDNAGLLRCLLRLYRLTGEARHAQVAQRVIGYLDAWLSDPETGAFYGSQDADEEFYVLPDEQRRQRPAPYVDRTVYTSWCALAASAYLEASWTLDRPELCERALRALAFLWERLYAPGQGMHRFFDGEARLAGLLADQVQTALALLDAYQVTGEPSYLERARDLTSILEERFWDGKRGGFFDVARGHETLGRLELPQKPLAENAACAELFLTLEHLTREQRYDASARRTLASFVGQHEGLGHFAASYAKVVDLALHPQADVKLVGPRDALEELHRAALRLRAPHRTVQLLDPARDAALLETLALPAEPAPAAYVCYGTACSAPVCTVEELERTVTTMREQATRAQLDDLTLVAEPDPETLD